MKTLIVTRPEEQAPPTLKALKADGYQVLSAPVMQVAKINFELPEKDRSLIVTSQNGVRYGLEVLPDRNAFVYAVGTKTAAVAKAAGFVNVHTGPGNAKGLLPPLIDGGRNHGMRYTHLCGEDLAYNIADQLQSEGIDADLRTCYRMVRVESLPDDVISAIKQGAVDGALFHSARAARGFEELVAEAGLTGALSGMDGFCFSSRVEAELIGPWRSLAHAMVPDERTLFGLINQTITTRDFDG